MIELHVFYVYNSKNDFFISSVCLSVCPFVRPEREYNNFWRSLRNNIKCGGCV